MGIDLKAKDLISRAIRYNIGEGATGGGLLANVGNSAVLSAKKRQIDMNQRFTQQDEGDNIFTKLLDLGKKLVGFLLGGARLVSISVTAIYGWLVGRVTALRNFDWNESDEALTTYIRAQNVAIATQWGGLAGASIGYLGGIVAGAGIGMVVPVIGGAALARTIAGAVGTEAAEELLPRLASVLTATAGAAANSALISGYMSARRLIKAVDYNTLARLFGNNSAEWIRDKWGAGGGPDLSFNSIVETYVENIDGVALKAFIEELLDESWDSFIESGFVISHELDQAYAQANLAKGNELGTSRSVEVVPDKNAPDEKLNFAGVPQKLLIPTVQAALNQHRLVFNRDLGSMIAQPVDEYIRARPQLRKLVLVFRGRETPPWVTPDGRRAKVVTYAIPDVKKGLTWQEIKAAAAPFEWGRYRATATLDNQRQMQVYGDSGATAEATLRRLMTLSTATILRLTISEEELAPSKLIKHAVKVYPAYGTLLARKQTLSNEGRTTIDNVTFDEEIKRFDLWMKEPPLGWQGLP